MKLLWTGTDALFYSSWPKYKPHYVLFIKLFARLCDLFVQEHYIVSEHLRDELKGLKKPIKVLIDPPDYDCVITKQPHKGINILYFYKPGRFWSWIYGTDIIIDMYNEYRDFNWIMVDGSQDMKEVYPDVDFYLRPNRHDGYSRMIMECDINDIPYYWSQDNPDINEIKKQLDGLRINANV